MAQVELEEQYVAKVDRLINVGVVDNREDAVRAGLESLVDLSEEELGKMKQARNRVNSYCDVHLGNMLGAGTPIRVVIEGKEYFKVPVKGEYEGKVYTYGYLLVDAKNLSVDESLSDSREKIHKNAEHLTGYDGTLIISRNFLGVALLLV